MSGKIATPPRSSRAGPSTVRWLSRASSVVACAAVAVGSAPAEAAPPIRTSAKAPVPACVTPARLDSFLAHHNKARGYSLAPRFHGIASWYREHGERHRVRWDYAFFQMLLETNFLSYRRGDGKWGDVDPKQNNFAGLGTTGGGVPGDTYPDVSTGVLAQIQHLVVYSGERLENPVGHRTRLKQDVILKSVAPIASKRPVTFADLARRWAADRHYGRSIDRIAALFRAEQCSPGMREAASNVNQEASAPASAHAPPPLPSPQQPPPRQQARAAAPQDCRVRIASYGAGRTLLIESIRGTTLNLTALEVVPGFEASLAQSFIATYAPAGRTLASFPNSAAAIAEAHAICRRVTKPS
jgi:hypothetical protein